MASRSPNRMYKIAVYMDAFLDQKKRNMVASSFVVMPLSMLDAVRDILHAIAYWKPREKSTGNQGRKTLLCSPHHFCVGSSISQPHRIREISELDLGDPNTRLLLRIVLHRNDKAPLPT